MYSPNVGAEDVDALRHSEEDIGAELAVSGETNNHDGSAVTHVVDCLLVSEAGRSGDDGGMGAQTVGGGLDVGNDVLGRLEVDPSLSTELET